MIISVDIENGFDSVQYASVIKLLEITGLGENIDQYNKGYI